MGDGGGEAGGQAGGDGDAGSAVVFCGPGEGALAREDVEAKDDGDDADEALDGQAVVFDALAADPPPDECAREDAASAGMTMARTGFQSLLCQWW
ncbi:MAG: hypothetical protein HC888_09755 [Candidatus Competibacteraceae bacterium]|nr:hypothetical protein [Candidatus Competibacteraceae bacterium]